MVEEELASIKGKIVSGVVTLSTRNFILNFFSFAANFILTILLSPAVFGIFFVVSAVISFLSYFSDVGLAAALIQKKEEPTSEELVSVFTLQQILVLVVIGIIFVYSPFLGSLYKLNAEGIFLLKALLFSFFLSSLKTIPSVLLERRLEFGLLAVPQIIETIAYYLMAIVLALMNFGLYSFAWAAIVRGIVGLIIIYIISPWKISLGLSIAPIRRLVTFGIPYQANSLLALVKDDLMTLFLGGILPPSHMGYIGWAKKWAESGLRVIMDSIIRVTFPAYARLQENREVLGKAIEKTLFYLAFFIFPTTVLLILFMKPLVYLIPKYSKWEPALLSFYFFAVASVFAAFSSPLVSALNSIGKIKMTLVLMVMWTVLTWIFIPAFAIISGYNGVAVASMIISITGILPVILTKRIIDFHVIKPLYKPFFASFLIAAAVFLSLNQVTSLQTIVISLISALIIYSLITWIWMREELSYLMPYILKLLSTLHKKD